jgi:hypothetical protein
MKAEYVQLLSNLDKIALSDGCGKEITGKGDLNKNARAFFLNVRLRVNSLYEDSTSYPMLLNNTNNALKEKCEVF